MQRENNENNVVVVGAGPVGLVTSLLLARMGHEVTIVERFGTPFPLPRAVGMDHESLRVLRSAGDLTAFHDVLAWDERLTHWQFVAGSGEVLMQIPTRARAESGWPEMQTFHQPDLEAMLVQNVVANPRIRVHRGYVVTAVDQDDDGADVHVAQADLAGDLVPGGAQATLRGRYVVGCDGVNSIVRKTMDVPMTDLGFSWDWLVVDILEKQRRDWVPLVGQVLAPPRTVSWVPSGPGRRRFEFMLLPGETPQSMNSREQAWRLLGTCGLSEADVTLVRHTVYAFRARWADRWRSGRLLLAGDSAHLTPPFLAQGLNSGIRDAATLAWRLDLVLRGISPPDTLDDYSVERIPHVRSLIQEAVEIGRLLCVVDPQECAVRDAMLRDAAKSGPRPAPVRRIGAGALAAGDERAGLLSWQGIVQTPHGRGHFDDVVGGNRFLLIGRTSDPVSQLSPSTRQVWDRLQGISVHIGRGGSVTDVDGTYAQWFDTLSCEVVLVRPDFYVFGTGTTCGDAERLVAELGRTLKLDARSRIPVGAR